MVQTIAKRTRRAATAAAITLLAALTIGCSASQKAIKSGDIATIETLAMEQYNAEKWSKAATLLEQLTPYYTNQPKEDTLQFYIARCKFKNKEYDYAVSLFDNFRRKFSRSPFLEDAEGMYTLAHYYLAPAPERDQSPTQLAIAVIDEFTARYPNSPEAQNEFKDMRGELLRRLHESNYLSAYTYYNIGHYKSAIVALKNALKKYPESAYREDILYYTVAAAYHLALNSIEALREERYLNMVDNYYSYIAEYPDSERRDEADEMVRKARKYLEAIKNGMTDDQAQASATEERHAPDRRERKK